MSTSKAALVAPVRLPLAVSSWNPVPAWSIERLANVAIPPTALTAAPPDRVPAGLPACLVSVTWAVLEVRLPFASRIFTFTAGVIVWPAPTFVGWTKNTRWSSGPAWNETAAVWAIAVPSAVAP